MFGRLHPNPNQMEPTFWTERLRFGRAPSPQLMNPILDLAGGTINLVDRAIIWSTAPKLGRSNLRFAERNPSFAEDAKHAGRSRGSSLNSTGPKFVSLPDIAEIHYDVPNPDHLNGDRSGTEK